MMPLSLFRIRNFAVGNLTTLTLYSGLGVATFFLVLFIQQVGGYTPVQAGMSLLPITVVVFLLSRRFGVLADRLGPQLFMGGGPIVAGLGLLLLVRVNGSADYVTQILPGVLVFALGLSMTVAPLTATVLGSVEPGHSGVASGINNAVSRVAGLLAIAALGAVVSGSFISRVDRTLVTQPLAPPARAALVRARDKPLVTSTSGVPSSDRPVVHATLVDASVYAFRIGIGIAAALAMLGGVVALVGIVNPRRRVRSADCPGGALAAAGGRHRAADARIDRPPLWPGIDTVARAARGRHDARPGTRCRPSPSVVSRPARGRIVTSAPIRRDRLTAHASAPRSRARPPGVDDAADPPAIADREVLRAPPRGDQRFRSSVNGSVDRRIGRSWRRATSRPDPAGRRRRCGLRAGAVQAVAMRTRPP